MAKWKEQKYRVAGVYEPEEIKKFLDGLKTGDIIPIEPVPPEECAGISVDPMGEDFEGYSMDSDGQFHTRAYGLSGEISSIAPGGTSVAMEQVDDFFDPVMDHLAKSLPEYDVEKEEQRLYRLTRKNVSHRAPVIVDFRGLGPVVTDRDNIAFPEGHERKEKIETAIQGAWDIAKVWSFGLAGLRGAGASSPEEA